MADKADIIVICGPTATGKTALSVALAKLLDGEVVSADSMQIYKGLRVGTAQATPEEMKGVPHHLVGFLPQFQCTQHSPVVVGVQLRRTLRVHLLQPRIKRADALLHQLGFQPCPHGRVRLIRCKVYSIYKAGNIQSGAAGHDWNASARRDLRDTLACVPDIVRNREPFFRRKKRSRPAQQPYRALLIGLNMPERAQLYARIDARVDAMLAHGLLEEARLVYANRDAYHTAAQAIGYKEFFPYFEGKEPLEVCTAALKQASRNYAKRQLTWFRRMDGLVWLPAGEPEAAEAAARLWAGHVKKNCGDQI